MADIMGKRDAHAHLDAVIPTRGTTMVVGKGFGEGEIVELDDPLSAAEWSRLSVAKGLAINADELVRKGTVPSRIRFVSVMVAGHAVMTIQVTLSVRHPTPVTAAQAKSYLFELPSSVDQAAMCYLYDVNQSGPLHD